MIKGRVIDVETRNPIQDAVVSIEWIKYKLGPPGLPWESKVLELAEDISDVEGQFEIPKYIIFNYDVYMSVYKNGYVCWSHLSFFPSSIERKGFKVKDGIVIELEPWKENYSKQKHARFTTSRSGLGPLFMEAIKEEIRIDNEYWRNLGDKRKK
jgi:hypothetical protein